MSCPDEIRLAENFEKAHRTWLACRDRDPINLRDEAEIHRLSQARIDGLTSRNVAATRLYEHRTGCLVCKSSRQMRP
jgi:hypothetical protein